VSGEILALLSATFFAVANVTLARGTVPGDADNGAFVSLLVTAAIAAICWIALGAAHGFAPVTGRALAWFAAAGVLTAFIGRVFGYAAVQYLGAMRASTTKRLSPFFAVGLGVAVLHERFTPGMAAGMGLIVGSFALLVWRGAGRKGQPTRESRIGYAYGVASALGYAAGALLRKMGLEEAPDVFLGIVVGMLVGAAMFLAAATFSRRYAAAVRATFSRVRPWVLAAAVMSSFGQVAFFAALNESSVSRVSLITSMEVFITIFLSVLFLRRHESLTPAVLFAAVLGFLGTAAIILY
jgi:drug/metabolite transporter (DMT)-like permease